MKRLYLHLLRQLVIAFLLSTAAVSFVVLFSQLFRLLSLVIDNSSTLWIFMELLSLSIPTFLPLVLPLGLGISILFVYHKLAVDSELVVMRGAGISSMRLALPAIGLSGLVVLLCLTLTLWLTPAANRELVALQYKIRNSYAIFLSRPGSFNDIAPGLTFYANRRGGGGALEGILIHDVRQPEMPVTIMADTGQVSQADGQPQIIIFNGRREEMDVTTGKLSQLNFDQYVLDLTAMRTTPSARLSDPREQSVVELLAPTPAMLKFRASRDKLIAELNHRFASPFLTMAYALIALAAILAGEFNRRGMARRILFASAAIIVVQSAYMSMNGIIARHIWLAFVLYLIALLPVITGLGVLNTDRLRVSRRKSRRRLRSA